MKRKTNLTIEIQYDRRRVRRVHDKISPQILQALALYPDGLSYDLLAILTQSGKRQIRRSVRILKEEGQVDILPNLHNMRAKVVYLCP